MRLFVMSLRLVKINNIFIKCSIALKSQIYSSTARLTVLKNVNSIKYCSWVFTKPEKHIIAKYSTLFVPIY